MYLTSDPEWRWQNLVMFGVQYKYLVAPMGSLPLTAVHALVQVNSCVGNVVHLH